MENWGIESEIGISQKNRTIFYLIKCGNVWIVCRMKKILLNDVNKR